MQEEQKLKNTMSHQPLSHWFDELQIPQGYTGFGVPPEPSFTSSTSTTQTLAAAPRTNQSADDFFEALRIEQEEKKKKEKEEVEKICREPQRRLKSDEDLLKEIKSNMMCKICRDYLAIYFVTCCKRTVICERCFKINKIKNGDWKCVLCNSSQIKYYKSLDMWNFLC